MALGFFGPALVTSVERAQLDVVADPLVSLNGGTVPSSQYACTAGEHSHQVPPPRSPSNGTRLNGALIRKNHRSSAGAKVSR
jgi:hypothetical protein